MADILELYQSATEGSIHNLKNVLEIITEHQALNTRNKDHIQIITADITKDLSRAPTRQRGLLTLKCLLESPAAADALVDHGQSWLGFCIAALKSPQHQNLAYSVLSEVLESCSQVHELDRSLVGGCLPDLLAVLFLCRPNSHLSALRCLETLLLRFSKPSGAHKSLIEKFLVQFLDSQDKRSVTHAAKCAHLLQQVRGGGEHGVNHKTSWKNQFQLYIRAIQQLLTEIYPESTRALGYSDYFNEENTENPKASSNLGPLQTFLQNICSEGTDKAQEVNGLNPVLAKAVKLSQRLENLIVFLQAMLVEPYPVAKCLSCAGLLEVLLRCQAAAGGRPSLARGETRLHRTVLVTLRGVIISLRGDVLPYTHLIMRMVLQALDGTKSEEYFEGIKPFKSVRIAAYVTLTTLLYTVRSLKPPSTDGEPMEDRLVSHVLADIMPPDTSMQLMVESSSRSVKLMSKKARRKLTMAQLEASGLSSHSAHAQKSHEKLENYNADLVTSALKCLEAFLLVCGNFLKTATHTVLQETLVDMLYRGCHGGNVECVGRALLAAQLGHSARQPGPLSHCLQLFSMQLGTPSFNANVQRQLALAQCVGNLRGAAPLAEAPLPAPTPRVTVTNTNSRALSALSNGLSNGSVIEVGDSFAVSSSEEEDSMNCNRLTAKKKKRSSFGTGNINKNANPDNFIAVSPRKRTKINESDSEVIELSDSNQMPVNQIVKPLTIDLEENDAMSDDVVCMEDDEICRRVVGIERTDLSEEVKVPVDTTPDDILQNEIPIRNCKSPMSKCMRPKDQGFCEANESSSDTNDATCGANDAVVELLAGGNALSESAEIEKKDPEDEKKDSHITVQEILETFCDVVKDNFE